MTMFALLLVTILFFASSSDALEIVLDNEGGGCMVNREFREAIDKFHNELRQKVAKGGAIIKGKSLGPAREMYGLIYDCALEREAKHETQLPGFADLFHRGTTNFSGEYESESYSALESLEDLLKKLYDDENSMRQMIYPKATRFGCWGKLGRGKEAGYRKIGWVCVYDNRPKNGEKLEGGSFCNKNDDCTFYKGSTCAWNLCYTWF